MYSANLNKNILLHEEEEDEVNYLPVTRKGFRRYNEIVHTSRSSLPIQSSYILKSVTVNYQGLLLKRTPWLVIRKPRRTLTAPKEPSKNNGYDNIQDDYILRVHDTLGDHAQYDILDLMGQGTFGQVVECKSIQDNTFVAIKVIKHQLPYLMQAKREVQILSMLREKQDLSHRFLQLRESFIFRHHMCIVFELLSISLHKLLSQQPGKPNMAIYDIQKISINVLETLALLRSLRIIHTDLKPDNILLKSIHNIHDVKLIDYGSALFETDKLEYRIQTACYRSPEVILKLEYSCAIDMWSFGCFVAELFIGRPLFPTNKEPVLIHMMTSLLKSNPPDTMIRYGQRSYEFFNMLEPYQLKELPPSPHDFPISSKSLKELVMGFPSDDHNDDRELLYDFLKHILVFDPHQRFTPQQALQHPFIAAVNQPILDTSPSKVVSASTTEESQEIATPVQQKTLKSPPLKSILKQPIQLKITKPSPTPVQNQQVRPPSTVEVPYYTTTSSNHTLGLSPLQQIDLKGQQQQQQLWTTWMNQSQPNINQLNTNMHTLFTNSKQQLPSMLIPFTHQQPQLPPIQIPFQQQQQQQYYQQK